MQALVKLFVLFGGVFLTLPRLLVGAFNPDLEQRAKVSFAGFGGSGVFCED